jgi:hypothetical protein
VHVWRGVAVAGRCPVGPGGQSPEPSRSAALHFPGCAAVTDAVTVERNNIDGGWQSLCGLCGGKTLFWRD